MATPATPPPRASLLGLPTEIKAHIVKLAHWQDLAYAERVKQALPKAKAIAELVKSPWMGRSVNALFMTNKELSGLAAAHLFEVISASKCTKPTFKFFVHSSHSHHFREVKFAGIVPTEAILCTLSYLSPNSAPNVSRLSIGLNTARKLLGPTLRSKDLSSSTEEAVNAVACFRTLAGRIKSLSLVDFPPSLAATMLSHFPAVQSLRFPQSLTCATNDLGLADALARCELSSLDVHLAWADAEQMPGIDPRWITDDWLSIGKLQSLRLSLNSLTSDEWSFVERFAGSLKHLDLDFLSLGNLEGTTDLPFLSTTFPRLNALRLRADAADSTHLLSLLSPFPLRDIRLVVRNIDEAALEPRSAFFAALGAHTPNLRLLSCSLSRRAAFDPTLDASLRRFCHSHHIEFSSLSSYSAHVLDHDYEEIEDARKVGTDDICGSIDEVLNFGLGRSAALREMEDLEGAKELLESTRALKGLQEVWRD